jgi:hypothetical protein
MTTGCPAYTPDGAFVGWQLLKEIAQLITSKGFTCVLQIPAPLAPGHREQRVLHMECAVWDKI